MPAALGEFIQLQNAGLISIDQTPISLIQPLQPPLNLPLGSLVLGSSRFGLSGRLFELGRQLIRITQQADNMLPDGIIQILAFHHPLRTRGGSGAGDAILAVALVITPFQLPPGGTHGDAVHGQTAAPTGHQAAQQIMILGIVAEREDRVVSQLGLGSIP
jgi:hypothetical protein